MSSLRAALEDPDRATVSGFRPGSESLLVAFGGRGGGPGMRPFEFARATEPLGCSRLFVRDARRAWYHAGLSDRVGGLDEVAGTLGNAIA